MARKPPDFIVCPYCEGQARRTDSAHRYHGRSYGMIYECSPCDAFVGTHEATGQPLGRPANAELRAARKEAHRLFDMTWKPGGLDRNDCYRWLAHQLSIEKGRAHMGVMDLETVRRVVQVMRREPIHQLRESIAVFIEQHAEQKTARRRRKRRRNRH